MGSFNDPAPGTCAVLPLVLSLIVPAEYDRLEAGEMNDAPHFIIVIAEVETQFTLGAADRTSTHHVHQGGSNQLHVMPVGGRDLDSQRYTYGFSEHAALDAAFASIARVGTCFFPHPAYAVWAPAAMALSVPIAHRLSDSRRLACLVSGLHPSVEPVRRSTSFAAILSSYSGLSK
jgi:hypothetical protein